MVLSSSAWPYVFSNVAVTSLAASVRDLSVAVVWTAAIMLTLLITAGIVLRGQPSFKKPLFTLMVVTVVITTLIMSCATLLVNFNSPTAGPVRWASDFEVWVCGNQLKLRGSNSLLTSRVGTPTLYMQPAGSIHFNGTPTTLPNDASLGAFMEAVDGEITDTALSVPLNNDNGFVGTPNAPDQVQPYIQTNARGPYASVHSGNTCGDEKAAVQAFAYRPNNDGKTYTQTKIAHPHDYELSHTAQAPPGDCIIMEFAAPADRTEHLCASYGIRDQDRCTDYGIAADKIASCDIREVAK